ncbi:HD domain-containing protein [Paractinoplanes durhamensis]|uniref:HD domain-containing protein n=1 Tax=Paractinoplanes durhamensis TaxID=113563 RepID=A0ABQ3YPQ7_9ACTN|nr:hypothetical protein Adu01nite_09110 [Actinoplanes durhamensis]
MPEDAEAIAAFGYELGLLKRVRRTGWWHAGVRDPESVAEHTMRMSRHDLSGQVHQVELVRLGRKVNASSKAKFLAGVPAGGCETRHRRVASDC